jgi:hypothetical protein
MQRPVLQSEYGAGIRSLAIGRSMQSMVSLRGEIHHCLAFLYHISLKSDAVMRLYFGSVQISPVIEHLAMIHGLHLAEEYFSDVTKEETDMALHDSELAAMFASIMA